MATPTVVTVTGTFHDGNGDPAIGFVTFSSPVTLLNASLDETLSPQRVKAVLDENGEISATLYATDDPDWSPDYTWKVIEVIRGRPNNEYHIELTTADTTVVLEDLTPVEPVEEFAQYIPVSQKGVANGVASLNNLGKVPSTQLPASSGGGGAVDSVNGEVGDVVLDYVDVGASAQVHTHDYSPTSHNHDSVYSGTAHTHDDRYFTEAEVSSSLSGKSDTSHNHDSSYATTGHTHDTRYYTESEADALLAGKSSTSHDHSGVYATPSQLTAHEADTTNVHGITDTSVLATQSFVTSAVSTHEADTTNVHGIADTSVLATQSFVTSAVSTHSSDTTDAHGIVDTADLIIEGDTRLTDARTPTAHNHAAADTNSGTFDIARIPTGTSGTTAALGNHTHAGSWSDATLGTNVTAGTSVNPGTRLEGDRVFIRGNLAWSSATLGAGHVLMTVAVAHRPASAKRFSVRTSPTSNVSTILNLATNGQLTNAASFGTTTTADCPIDGLNYELS